MTLMMRPKVSAPTGILMGEPQSSTPCPLTRPSVPSIAIVLTVFSPKKILFPKQYVNNLFIVLILK